jgi:DNA-binding response OmpR family regulator
MQRVLLADDDRTMVTLLKTLLGMEGYEVVTLLDMDGDLLDNIRSSKPDILIIDIYLGKKNGLDIVRQIRNAPDLKDVRIIMVSGIDKTDECLAAGANNFLQKPYMPNELFDLLRA